MNSFFLLVLTLFSSLQLKHLFSSQTLSFEGKWFCLECTLKLFSW